MPSYQKTYASCFGDLIDSCIPSGFCAGVRSSRTPCWSSPWHSACTKRTVYTAWWSPLWCIDPSMDLVPRGALTSPTARQCTPLHCGPVSWGADLKGESNVTLMKGMPFFQMHTQRGLWVCSVLIVWLKNSCLDCVLVYSYILSCKPIWALYTI